jgi:antitoxin component of RelBE/YafQ-DinJ toxin-antitoxin module
MYIIFPADEAVKDRLDAVCKALKMTYEEWFKIALQESESAVLKSFLSDPEKFNHLDL